MGLVKKDNTIALDVKSADIIPTEVNKCELDLNSQRHLVDNKVNLTLGTIMKRRYSAKLNEKRIEVKPMENSELNCKENSNNANRVEEIFCRLEK